MASTNHALDTIEGDRSLVFSVGGVQSITRMNTDSSHSHLYHLISSDGTPFLLRVIFDSTLAGSPECVRYAYNGMAIAAAHRISPSPIYVNEEKSLLVEQFIQHVPHDLHSAEAMKLRAFLGRKIMQLEFSPDDFRYLHVDFETDFARHYQLLEECRTLSPDLYSAHQYLKTLFADALKLCIKSQSELDSLPDVLSHNDLGPDNLLKDADGHYWLIDFECIGVSHEDFLMGQLALVARVYQHLEGKDDIATPFSELYEILNESALTKISERLFYARILERIAQAIAYGLRQIARQHAASYSSEYIELKWGVVSFCIDLAQEVLEWNGRIR